MTVAKDLLARVLELPEDARVEMANALLDSLHGPDFATGLSQDEFVREMRRRAEASLENPSAGKDWSAIRDELQRRYRA